MTTVGSSVIVFSIIFVITVGLPTISPGELFVDEIICSTEELTNTISFLISFLTKVLTGSDTLVTGVPNTISSLPSPYFF